MKPELNAASAPQKLIVRSEVPWTSTFDLAGTDVVSSVDPAIRPMFQPKPKKKSPTNISAGTYPASTVAIVPPPSTTAPI